MWTCYFKYHSRCNRSPYVVPGAVGASFFFKKTNKQIPGQIPRPPELNLLNLVLAVPVRTYRLNLASSTAVSHIVQNLLRLSILDVDKRSRLPVDTAVNVLFSTAVS
eukprot:SAG31_NODE_79_length_27235_cov_6.268868_8_plen_107_part_00